MLVIEPVHTRIVRGPIVEQDPVVEMHGQIAQDPGELTSGELARSTGAVGIRGQSLHFVSLLSWFYGCSRFWGAQGSGSTGSLRRGVSGSKGSRPAIA